MCVTEVGKGGFAWFKLCGASGLLCCVQVGSAEQPERGARQHTQQTEERLPPEGEAHTQPTAHPLRSHTGKPLQLLHEIVFLI